MPAMESLLRLPRKSRSNYTSWDYSPGIHEGVLPFQVRSMLQHNNEGKG